MRFFTFILFIFILKTPLAQTEATFESTFTLSDFLSENSSLDKRVDSIYELLSIDVRVAQLLMPAVGKYGLVEDSIKYFIEKEMIGGVLLLNGTKDQFTKWVTNFNTSNAKTGNTPFLYSADAEPSLVNRKIIGSTVVPKASQIKSEEEVRDVAATISDDLNAIGINYNFSPVVDMSPNKTVGYRGFGTVPENVVPFSKAFIEQTQKQNILATAKHFPGHGYVSGDTHHSLQVIDGELRELENYPPLIQDGVLSIMVAHIAVKNNKLFNTDGLPATTSKPIVTNLLRDSLNFKGLIVTDAMNMGGVTQVKDASIKAIEAGCDILLMPLNTEQSHRQLKRAYAEDSDLKAKIDTASKRIIRMKICLGLI